jgi:hypothetical protein
MVLHDRASGDDYGAQCKIARACEIGHVEHLTMCADM